ncbi:restriction endonuclease subunit S [Streptococcus suis]|uniref:restriction endonuclease subunit S n=1 Tax=Streptococcus suis TaxID=1307 RepID=UPI00195F7EB9|nr:restriction endonuclease subunit S [Streptococcus suis]MBM7138463.1 restriction endonuclease subunit S [Streptococcus suis]MBY4601710.1 restriction endonuclease subunit S [Streptococcus suis]MCO8173144.1 restriction endonuclease subunit S [Streptococcus suis]MCO8181486.1 restriction endonuclease subunit S [Streptococcus suis]MCO8192201.1 restriction endonuclease subunit S [Streptococcus suis]
MTRMKDSGIEWIGEVPEEWGITKIKFTTQLNGRIGWQGLTSAEYKEEGPYLITGTDFLDGKINFETAVHIDEKRWFEAKQIQVENGDLLITKDGTVGKVAIIEGLNEKASLNSGVLRIQTTENISRRFLFYVLKSDVFWLWFNYTNSGASTILHLYQNVFDEFSFTFPNVSEQNQIADFLDKKVAQLDKVKSLLEEQIKTLEDYRQSLIYETVTKGLDKTVPLKDSGVDWIGQIPEGWEVKNFKYVATIKDGTHDTPEYFVEGVPLITSKNLDSVQNRIDFDSAKNISYDDHIKISQRSNVKKGDILMPMIGTIGGATQVLVEKEFSIKNVALFKVAHDEALSRFLYYQLNSRWTNSQLSFMMSGGVQSFVSLNMLSKVKLIIPTSEEIKKINLFLDSGVGKINKMISIKKEQIENINKQRQTLIYDYVTGKRRV